MGAVLYTVNIRVAPAQIAYTIDHAEDDVILIHADFLPPLSEVMKLLIRKVRLILLRDDASAQPESDLSFITSYDEMIEQALAGFEFQDFDENIRDDLLYHRHHRRAQGGRLFAPPACAAYHGGACRVRAGRDIQQAASR